LSPTTTAPIDAAARYTSTHAVTFGALSAMRSPRPMPSDSSPAARLRVRSCISAKVISSPLHAHPRRVGWARAAAWSASPMVGSSVISHLLLVW
jgi:hypothetical protein